MERVSLALLWFLPDNNNQVGGNTRALLRFHHHLLKQLSPLRFGTQFGIPLSQCEHVTCILQCHQPVIGEGLTLFMNRWKGGGIDVRQAVLMENGSEVGDPTYFR